MSRIEKLPPVVVNQIAAGEVIERPASVVKELVENALDAGATRVDVTLLRGGVELVRVVDNGRGIPPEELPLAVLSHATSKIRSAEDLERVQTLGFRGEALASIAAVSQLRLASRPAQQRQGAELSTTGSESEEVLRRKVRPWGGPPGTVVEVNHLFYNAPVRRKFLRSTQTETSHATEAVLRLALAHPQVHFTLRHGKRLIYDLPPQQQWLRRIEALFGRETAQRLIPIQGQDGPVRLSGYVGHPELNRPHTRWQYLFLNGRPVRDRSLTHALNEAYRGLLLTGRYPVCFLRLEMPPEMVDVNVHPTKLEVRFQDGSRVYSQLLGTLRRKFLETDLGTRLQVPSEQAAAPEPQPGPQSLQFVDWAKAQLARQHQAQGGNPAGPHAPPPTLTQQLGENPFVLPPGGYALPEEPAPSAVRSGTQETSQPQQAPWDPEPPSSPGAEAPGQAKASPAEAFPPQGTEPPRAMQVHNRYLVVEEPQGIVVIDQHALHERVLYEQLRERVAGGPLPTQRLLVPQVVELTPEELATVRENQALLAQLGFELEAFGGQAVAVQSHPALLPPGRLEEAFRELVHRLSQAPGTPGAEAVLDPLLHLLACKAAVKAGDPLSEAEIQALLRQRHLAQNTHHCPHGRPTALLLSREELDRQFLRT